MRILKYFLFKDNKIKRLYLHTMFHFLHIQTDSDKYRIRSRYGKHHIYGSHGLLLHIRPDLPLKTNFFHFPTMQSCHQNGSRKI